MTQTINELFGSKVTVPGTGLILNNTIALFDPHPGNANSIAPHKRMLSSVSPTVVLKDGKPFMALGTPGGTRIFPAVLQAIVNVVDFGMTLQEAVEAPRVWTQGQALQVEQGIAEETRRQLRSMGHELEVVARVAGGMNGVLLDHGQGLIHGAGLLAGRRRSRRHQRRPGETRHRRPGPTCSEPSTPPAVRGRAAVASVAAGSASEGEADLAHLVRRDASDEPAQPCLVDGLYVIEVGGRGELESLVHTDRHFGGGTVDGRGNGSDHHRAQQRDHLLPADDQHRPPFVRSRERVLPDLASIQLPGHEPSSLQPASSSLSSSPSAYASRYCSAIICRCLRWQELRRSPPQNRRPPLPAHLLRRVEPRQ